MSKKIENKDDINDDENTTQNIENDIDTSDTMPITVQDSSGNTAIPVGPEASSNWVSMIPIVLIFFVMYFLLIRPQEKRRKELENKISNIKKGDEVVTLGGIFGTVHKVSDDSFLIDVGNGVIIKVLKAAISSIQKK